MSLVKRNNVVFPALMSELFSPDWFGGIEKQGADVTPVNIKEKETGFSIELAVPGRDKSDFVIDVEKDLLTVSAEVKNEEELDLEGYTRREFSMKSFKRTFTLPDSVDVEAVKASYENGVLVFELPKKKESLPKPKRLIQLS